MITTVITCSFIEEMCNQRYTYDKRNTLIAPKVVAQEGKHFIKPYAICLNRIGRNLQGLANLFRFSN